MADTEDVCMDEAPLTPMEQCQYNYVNKLLGTVRTYLLKGILKSYGKATLEAMKWAYAAEDLPTNTDNEKINERNKFQMGRRRLVACWLLQGSEFLSKKFGVKRKHYYDAEKFFAAHYWSDLYPTLRVFATTAQMDANHGTTALESASARYAEWLGIDPYLLVKWVRGKQFDEWFNGAVCIPNDPKEEATMHAAVQSAAEFPSNTMLHSDAAMLHPVNGPFTQEIMQDDDDVTMTD